MPNFEMLVAEESKVIEGKLPNPIELMGFENESIVYLEEPGTVINLEQFFSNEGLKLGENEVPANHLILTNSHGDFLYIERDNRRISSSDPMLYITLNEDYECNLTSGGDIKVGNVFRYDFSVKFNNDYRSEADYDFGDVVGVFVTVGEEGKKELESIKRLEIPRYDPFDPWWDYKSCFYVFDDIEPSEKRSIIRSNLEKFQEKLIWQKEGIAESIEKIYDAIIKNPEITFIDYLKIRNSFASEYLLTREQLNSFDLAFTFYREKHSVVSSYFENYPDKNSLFETCFGDKPIGEIEVIKGPMFIHFRCLNMNDYAFLHSVNSNYGDRKKVSVSDAVYANQTSGFAFSRGFIKSELSGCLSVERGGLQVTKKNILGKERAALIEYDIEQQESIRNHEWQHLFNILFSPMENQQDIGEIMRESLERSSTVEEATQQIIQGIVYNTRREYVDPLARDEILAYLKDGTDLPLILDTLSDDKNYDYREIYKDWISTIPNQIRELSYNNPIDEEPLKIEDSDVLKHIDTVFGVKYKQDLKSWIDAVSILEKKGFTREQVVNLLYQEPVNSWINLARRMRDRV